MAKVGVLSKAGILPKVGVLPVDENESIKLQRYKQPIQEESIPYWHFPTFVRQFAWHIFLPFSLPLHYLATGSIQHNVQFSTQIFDVINLLFHIFVPTCFWGAPAVYIIWHDSLVRQGVVMGEVLVCMAVVLVHRGMVALKYAMMSPSERKTYFSCDVPKVVERWGKELQLTTGWMNLSDALLARELQFAAIACDVDLERIQFNVKIESAASKRRESVRQAAEQLPDKASLSMGEVVAGVNASRQLSAMLSEENVTRTKCQGEVWMTFLASGSKEKDKTSLPNRWTCKDLWNKSDGNVGGAEMMAAVLRHSMQLISGTERTIWKIVLLLTLGQSLLPGIFRVASGTGAFWGSTWQAKLVTSMCFCNSLLMTVPLSQFLCVGVLDYYRQWRVAVIMGDLIRLAMRPGQRVPFFDMHVAENVRGWTECRLLLSSYAMRWRMRIAGYTIATFMLVVVLVLSLARQFIGSFKTVPDDIWKDVMLWFCVFDLFVFTTFLTVMILFGALANDEVKRHKRILIHHRIVLRRRDTHAKDKGESDMEELDDLLDTAMQTLDVMDESTPCTVVGMRAERSLAIYVVGLVTSSFFLAILQVWMK